MQQAHNKNAHMDFKASFHELSVYSIITTFNSAGMDNNTTNKDICIFSRAVFRHQITACNYLFLVLFPPSVLATVTQLRAESKNFGWVRPAFGPTPTGGIYM